MVKIFAIILCLFLSSAKAYQNESFYSDTLCTNKYNGYVKRLPSGIRPDCETSFAVIEFDWAKRNKAYECLGQALTYSKETGKLPVCVLLIRSESEARFGNNFKILHNNFRIELIDLR